MSNFVYLFQQLFEALFPLLVILFVVGLILQIFMPKRLLVAIGLLPEEGSSNEKGKLVCYQCTTTYKEEDVFCGNCGYNLHG
ncbi:MAG: hypothetical protein ACW990_00060 [Promethearchaeota archaeon]